MCSVGWVCWKEKEKEKHMHKKHSMCFCEIDLWCEPSTGWRLESVESRVELKNVCCLDVPHVQRELYRAKERLRHRKPVLCQCFAHAGYSL